MKKKFTYSYFLTLMIVAAVWVSFAFTINIPIVKADTTNYFSTKKNTKKKSLLFAMPPIKAGTISSVKLNVPRADDKLLSAVEVFPNPVVDEIKLKYTLARNSSVTIKLMDILGNEVFSKTTLVEPGERSYTYPVSNKISKGFYFIRVGAGTELVIKRISIL